MLRKQRSGFTLIELLVVVAIICVLAAIILPMLQLAKLRSYRTSCQNNLHQLIIAANMYADDWDGFLPPVDANNGWPGWNAKGEFPDVDPWSLYNLLRRYAKKTDVFMCDVVGYGYPWDPGNGKFGVLNYHYHPNAVVLYNASTKTYTAAKKRDLVIRPTRSVLIMDMWELFPHQDGANYAFVDSHVMWYKTTVYGFYPAAFPPFYYP